jgi:hypothetical protein
MINAKQYVLSVSRASQEMIHTPVCWVDIAGDLVSGILLGQILYWHGQDKNGNSRLKVRKDDGYWLAKKHTDWWDEIRLTEKQVVRALAILEEKEVIVTKIYRFAGSPTTHIQVDFDRLGHMLSEYQEKLASGEFCAETTQREVSKPPKGKNGNLPKGATLTETTTETTTERKTDSLNLLLQGGANAPVDPLQEHYAQIKSEPTQQAAEKAAREALKAGATLASVSALLSSRLKDSPYKPLPRFASRLAEPVQEGNEALGLALLWRALAEDVGGVDYADNSKTMTALVGAYKKNLLSRYSYDQCLWTLKKVALDKSSVDYLVSGGRNLITLVHQRSKEYHELLQERRRSENERIMREKLREEQAAAKKEEEPLGANVTKFTLLNAMFDKLEEQKNG